MRRVPASMQLWQQLQSPEAYLACLHLAELCCWDQMWCPPPQHTTLP